MPTASGDGDTPRVLPRPLASRVTSISSPGDEPLAQTAATRAPAALAASPEALGLRRIPTPTPTLQTASVSREHDASRTRREDLASAAAASRPSEDEKLLLDLVNVERTTRGLRPLAWDPSLTRIARLHDDDQRSSRRISHFSSRDGADLTARLTRGAYHARLAAENVAFDATVVKAHRALMNSAGHRRNILDPDLESIGVAVVRASGSDWIYVVEDFATPFARMDDDDAESRMATVVSHAGGRVFTWLPEDRLLSGRLDSLVERMIADDSVEDAVGGGVGEGATLALTLADPSRLPSDVLAKAARADGYALSVRFRRTPRYPMGTYWTVLFLHGVVD